MTARRRLAAAAVAAALFVAGTAGCRSDNPVLETGAIPPEEVRNVSVEVRGGAVVGDLQVIVVEVGQRVRLAVRSDVVDEVEIVETDVRLQVPAGGVATLELPTDAPAVNDIRLVKQNLTVARLEVGQ